MNRNDKVRKILVSIVKERLAGKLSQVPVSDKQYHVSLLSCSENTSSLK